MFRQTWKDARKAFTEYEGCLDDLEMDVETARDLLAQDQTLLDGAIAATEEHVKKQQCCQEGYQSHSKSIQELTAEISRLGEAAGTLRQQELEIQSALQETSTKHADKLKMLQTFLEDQNTSLQEMRSFLGSEED